MKRLSALLLLTGAALCAADPVVLKNPDFEAGVANWHNNGRLPKGVPSSAALIPVNGDGENRTGFLKLHDEWEDGLPYAIQHFQLPAVPDRRFTLSCRAKAPEGHVFAIGVQCLGGKKYLTSLNRSCTGTGKWQDYKVVLTGIPAQADQFTVNLFATRWDYKLKGTVCFDDIKLLAERGPVVKADPISQPTEAAGNFGKLVITNKDRHLTTDLVKDGKPQAAIVGDKALAAKLNAVIRAKTGKTLPVLKDTAYGDAEKLDRNLIVIGSRDNNRTMSNLYNRYYSLIDAKYPGPGGSDLHSLHNPFGDLHNVILAGGSDPEGDALAVEKLVKLIDGLPAGRSLKLGFISQSTLSPSYKVPRDVKDIPTWGENLSHYMGFGWNSLAKNLAMLYITNDPFYKNEFMRLAFPDKETQKELFKRDGEAYRDDISDPIVNAYHYLGAQMTLYWDLVDENPLFTDAERLKVTKKFYQQLSLRAGANYMAGYRAGNRVIRPDRHAGWEAMLVYTTARYLHKDYPCHDTETGLRIGRNAMEPLFKTPMIGNIMLGWVVTSVELQFYYAGMQGHRLVGCPAMKLYANGITQISNLGKGTDDRVATSASLTMYLEGAYYAQDQAMIELMRNKFEGGHYAGKNFISQTVFRLGHSFWPAKPYPGNSVAEHAGKWNEFTTHIPADPQKTEMLFASFRSANSQEADYLLIDPHYCLGLRDPQHNHSMLYAYIKGIPVLAGYETALIPFANGLASGKYPFDATVTGKGTAGNYAWFSAKVPDFNGFDWERTWLLKKGQYLLAFDRLTACRDIAAAKFDIKFAPGYAGKVTVLPNGDFSAQNNYLAPATVQWSFSDDVPFNFEKQSWSTLLAGDRITFMPDAKNMKSGDTRVFGAIFRPGTPAETRGSARNGNVFSFRTPDPALVTLTQEGFTLADAKETLTVTGNQGKLTSGNAGAADQALAMLAKRPVKAYQAPALPGKLRQARWEQQVSGTPGKMVLAKDQAGFAADKTFTVFNTATGFKVISITASSVIKAVGYEPKTGFWLIGTQDEHLTAYNAKGEKVWTFTSEMAPEVLKYGPYWHKSACPGIYSIHVKDGLIYAGSASTVEILNPADGKLVKRVFILWAPITAMWDNPANDTVSVIRSVGGSFTHEISRDFKVRTRDRWALALRDNLNTYGFNMVGQQEIIFFRDASGKWLAADLHGGAQNRFMIRDAKDGKALYEADFGTGVNSYNTLTPTLSRRTMRGIAAADCNGDGALEFACAKLDGSLYIFNAKAQILKFQNALQEVQLVTAGKDAFYAGLADGRIIRFDLRGITQVGKIDGAPVALLKVLPDGRLLAASATGTVAAF